MNFKVHGIVAETCQILYSTRNFSDEKKKNAKITVEFSPVFISRFFANP